MTFKRVTTFRLDDKLFEGLQLVWRRDGVPPSEQVRRGIRMWLEAKGVNLKAAPRHAQTRRKA